MNTFPLFLISIIFALWVSAIALVSVQNAVPVSLRFLVFESIQLPFGLVLAFSASIGLIAGAILIPLWGLPSASRRSSASVNAADEDDEFDF
uniref:LapA family protein n=1 Tax=Desertifilum tharense IPPAS B-1220 TaxID=1781255 RepID=A0ACD5GPP1_9CYAN